MGATTVTTGQITNSSITISASQNVVRLTVLCKTGTLQVYGGAIFSGLSNSANVLTTGQGFTLTSASISQPIDGLSITAPTINDVVEIMLATN
jgi:hypothetical protein